jgi:steroid delta-isomerase-like uncharacterized protein
MKGDPNDQLNERWVQAFNDQDWAAEAACRTLDYSAHMQGAPGSLDSAGWASFMSMFATAFPDVRITIVASISQGDTVASRWTMTGTHGGDFLGIPATGREINMNGIDFSRVVDGKIAEHWAQYDIAGVLRQLGALPAPA